MIVLERLALVALVLWVCFSRAEAVVVLPIEIMGPDGVVESANVTLESSEADVLWLQAHNLSYDEKASVRVNGGAWIDLKNSNPLIAIEEPDRSYSGIGGGFSTIRLAIDVADDDFVVGENQIDFRFNASDGVSSGFRILAFNILDAEGTELLAESAFVEDDPALWVAPLPGAEAIAAGKNLWENADLKAGTGEPWLANCASCHSVSGSDLKYFNFSNKSIVARSVFHALTEEEGQQIASYIRSLDYYAPAQARPWNPPYQPGPGIDSKPVYEWAAGAGLDAVLASDAEMLPYMLGDGTREAIDAATDIRSDMNLREMPVAVQFPDWRLWLPRIHPLDIWGRDIWENSDSTAARFGFLNAHDSYEDLKGRFEDDDLANADNLINRVERFSREVMWWWADASSGHPWTDEEGPNALLAINNGFRAEEAKLALSGWHAVKLWEMLHAYGAEDKVANLRATAEKYQWPTNESSVFHIAAHFIGDDRGTSAFIGEDLIKGTYFSSIWYQLQMVLNSGMRSGYKVAPVDWAYNYFHVNRLGERTGVYEPLRQVQNLIKGYQQRDQPGRVTDRSWTMREVSPWRVYSDFKGDQSTMALLDQYQPGLRLQVTNSLIHQFLRRANEYQLSDWTRTALADIRVGSATWEELEHEDYIPRAVPHSVTRNNLFARSGEQNGIEADSMIRLIPRLADLGAEPSLVNGLIDWSKQFWPLADWEAFRLDLWLDSDADGMPDEWEGRTFGNLLAEKDGDLDADGLSNFIEYAIGNNPEARDTDDVEKSLVMSYQEYGSLNPFLLQYVKRIDDPTLSFSLELSYDGKIWIPFSGSESEALISGGTLKRVEALVPDSDANAVSDTRLFRLKVSRDNGQ